MERTATSAGTWERVFLSVLVRLRVIESFSNEIWWASVGIWRSETYWDMDTDIQPCWGKSLIWHDVLVQFQFVASHLLRVSPLGNLILLVIILHLSPQRCDSTSRLLHSLSSSHFLCVCALY